MKEKLKQSSVKFILLIISILSTYLIIKYAFWTLFPFIFALGVAFIIRKTVVILIKLTGLRIKEASFVLLSICYIAFFTSIYFLFDYLLGEGIKLAEHLPQIYQNEIEPIISDYLNDSKIQDSLINLPLNEFKNLLSKFVVEISGKIANFALNIPEILITATVTIVASFFLSVDYDNIRNNILGLLDSKIRTRLKNIKKGIVLSLGKMLKCYLILFVVTFSELFIGLCLLGVKYPFTVAFFIAFADFLPLIGTGTILIPWALFSIISGKSAFSIAIIALYLIITVIRNIIEPKILGKNIGIHPLITLASMYIGLKLGGFLMAFTLPMCLMIFKTIKNDKQI